MKPVIDHHHPDGGPDQRGAEIEPGDILQVGDVYASRSGDWMFVHANWHGQALCAGTELVVRPTLAPLPISDTLSADPQPKKRLLGLGAKKVQ